MEKILRELKKKINQFLIFAAIKNKMIFSEGKTHFGFYFIPFPLVYPLSFSIFFSYKNHIKNEKIK